MYSIKLFEQFINELKLSTWRSASDKAKEVGRDELSSKFKDKFFSELKRKQQEEDDKRRARLVSNIERAKKHGLRDEVLLEHTFEYHIKQYRSSNKDYEYNDNIEIFINDDFPDAYSYMFVMLPLYLNRDEELIDISKEIWNDNMSDIDSFIDSFGILETNPLRIDIILDPPYIIDSYNPDNKFSNRKSAINFINTLHKLYNLDDKDKRMNIIYKLNDFMGDRPAVQNDPFYEFINKNFGSWDNFRNKLDIRKLYKRND